jgi:hypothetical protein
MAEAVAFLISALTSLRNISVESSPDRHAESILASASGKVVEALSALDYLSVTQWTRSGSTAIGAATIPVVRREENRISGSPRGSRLAAGCSVDRARRVTYQHTPRRFKRFATPSLINFL